MNTGASDLSLDQTKAALRPAGLLTVLLVVLKGLLVVTTLIPPALTGLFVDEVLVGRNADRLWLMLGAFLAVYGVETVLKAVEILMQNRAVHRVVFRQRMRVFRSIQRLPWSELMRHAPGELLKRVEDDSEELGALLLQRIERIFNWCLIVVGGVVCVAMSWQLALAASALTTLLWLAGRWIKRQAGVRSHAHREAMGRWSAWLHESLLGWREVRMLAIENEQSAKMAAWLRRINRLRGASHTFTYLQHAIGRLQEHYVSQATLYFLGGVLIFAGSLTLGGLIAFMRYFARVLDAADRINALNAELGNLQPRLRRSFEVTEWPQIPPPRARLAPAVVPEIELRDVVLAYDGAEPVLRGVDCVISRQQPGSCRGLLRQRQVHHCAHRCRSAIAHFGRVAYRRPPVAADRWHAGAGDRDSDWPGQRRLQHVAQGKPAAGTSTKHRRRAVGSLRRRPAAGTGRAIARRA